MQEAGAVAPERALTGDVSVDVVVVGGGYTGMWAAAPASRVAVVDAEVCASPQAGFVDHLAQRRPAPARDGG